jgi:hypothetical protein
VHEEARSFANQEVATMPRNQREHYARSFITLSQAWCQLQLAQLVQSYKMPQVEAFALDDLVYCLQIDALGRVKIHVLIAIMCGRAMLHLKPCFSQEPLDGLFKPEPVRSPGGERLVYR